MLHMKGSEPLKIIFTKSWKRVQYRIFLFPGLIRYSQRARDSRSEAAANLVCIVLLSGDCLVHHSISGTTE